VFVLIGVLCVLAMFLVVTTSVAYLALPKGCRCPWCGTRTSSVRLPRVIRLFSSWVQRRWCSSCGWEGPSRYGPDLRSLDSPVNHDSEFRWDNPRSESIHTSDWQPDNDDA
ncbi:uncharacterized protein METZ01_LOCUS149229, partial [marine metagenome]